MTEKTSAKENFLIPDGTFFVELTIFLIVFAVIRLFVVPPLRDILEQRQSRVADTIAHRQRAADTFAAAQDSYHTSLAQARIDAAQLREHARKEGQAMVTTTREHAQAQSDDMVAAATSRLRAHAAETAQRFEAQIDPLAADLADRLIGGGHR